MRLSLSTPVGILHSVSRKEGQVSLSEQTLGAPSSSEQRPWSQRLMEVAEPWPQGSTFHRAALAPVSNYAVPRGRPSGCAEGQEELRGRRGIFGGNPTTTKALLLQEYQSPCKAPPQDARPVICRPLLSPPTLSNPSPVCRILTTPPWMTATYVYALLG